MCDGKVQGLVQYIHVYVHVHVGLCIHSSALPLMLFCWKYMYIHVYTRCLCSYICWGGKCVHMTWVCQNDFHCSKVTQHLVFPSHLWKIQLYLLCVYS